MENAGLSHEGCLRQHVNKWGHYVDINLYGLLQSDWKGHSQ